MVTFVLRDRKTKKVLHEWDSEFTDWAGRGWSSPMFKMSLLEHYEQRLKELFRVDVTVHNKGWKRKKA